MMSLKSKGFGLALLAAMAMSTVVAVNASATVSGHFINDAFGGHAIVNQKSSAESTHQFVFKIDNQSTIQCDEFSAFGTVTAATVQQVSGSTTFVGCRTEGEASGSLAIHTNGCTGTGFSNSTGAVTGGLDCPVGKSIVVTHPNCTINVPPQANVSGFTTTQITLEGKHAITLDANVQYTIHYEAGICVFLGTKHTMFITGSTVIRGTDTEGNYINITST
jgi:hypothetical protein